MKKNLKSQVSLIIALIGTGASCSKSTLTTEINSSAIQSCIKREFLRNHGQYLNLQVGEGPKMLKPLFGHVPLATQFSQDLGSVNDSEAFDLTIALSYQNEARLESELADLYNPESPKFHQFLSPQEFNFLFGPTESQIALVRAALLAHGFTLRDQEPHGILIHAQGSAESIENLFHTEIHHFKDLKSDLTYFAPAYELQTPTELPIRWIHGLDNQLRARHHAILTPSSERNQGMTPREIKKAYSLTTPLGGKGQTLALVELDAYRESDIRTYEKQFGLGPVPLENIFIGSAQDKPGAGAPEVTLDIQLMIALAPQVQKILVYEGVNSAQGIIDVYNKIAQDHRSAAISTSWGMSEVDTPSSLLQTENAIFKQMAAQGQAFFAASGDSGAYDTSSQLAVDDPASQPYVTGVGGTKLSVKTDGSYAGETTWSDPSTGAGGGGGVSTVWSQPTWQKGVISPDSKGSTTMRNVPDVSLNSDPQTGYAIYVDGKWHVAGGTSCAAPLWAALAALVNQNRQAQGLSPLGFPLPAIYAVARSNLYHSAMHNISDGSTNLYYPAVPGFNDATGWGSFQGDQLIHDLSQNPTPRVPQPSPSATTTPGSISPAPASLSGCV